MSHVELVTYTYFTAECCGPAFRQADDKNICHHGSDEA